VRRAPRLSTRSGLTLVELVLAAGLLSLLMVALFALLDDFLGMWEKSEQRRQLVEETSGVLELLVADLTALDPGPRGDVLCEWILTDTDGDGVGETKWPRLRLVRHASPAELQRLLVGRPADVLTQGLIEVIWTMTPAHPGATDPDLRAEGFLWRGERIWGPPQDGDVSFFDDAYLSEAGQPRPGTVNEVSGGILWLGLQLATQTSLVQDGWTIGGELPDAAASWDAWARGRPDPERHYWNEPAAGMPPPRGRPVLPRRVRIELELERERDLKRRTRLTRPIEATDARLDVVDGERIPSSGSFVLVGSEWMEVTAVVGDSVTVVRGARGTQPALHEVGDLVHWGAPAVREVRVPLCQEDWNL